MAKSTRFKASERGRVWQIDCRPEKSCLKLRCDLIKSSGSRGGKTDIKILKYDPALMPDFILRPAKFLGKRSLPQ